MCSLIPVGIIGAISFYDTFVDILSTSHARSLFVDTRFIPAPGIIGYWSTVWAVIVLTEHFIFRKNTWANYDLHAWNHPHKLPWGLAAASAFFISFAIIIPSMNQAWYVGPIARAGTGDIGILAGSGVGLVLFLAFRTIEKSYVGR